MTNFLQGYKLANTGATELQKKVAIGRYVKRLREQLLLSIPQCAKKFETQPVLWKQLEDGVHELENFTYEDIIYYFKSHLERREK